MISNHEDHPPRSIGANLRNAVGNYDAFLFDFHHGTFQAYFDAISIPARHFLDEHLIPHSALGLTLPDDLFVRRWHEVDGLVDDFWHLTEAVQLELAILYTLPVQKTRQFLDCSTTPLAAHCYSALAQDYIAFQEMSPHFLSDPRLISTGGFSKVEERFDTHGIRLAGDVLGTWRNFTASVLQSDALGVFSNRGRDVALGWKGAPEDEWHPIQMGNYAKLAKVTLNSVYNTWSSGDDLSTTYVDPTVLLEGRTVVRSLLWLITSLSTNPVGADDERIGRLLARYVEDVSVGSVASQGHVWALELGSSLLNEPSFQHAARTCSTADLYQMLCQIDLALWYSLHSPNSARLDSHFKALAPSQTDLDESITLASLQVEEMRRSCVAIWNMDVRSHFEHIFTVLANELDARVGGGNDKPNSGPGLDQSPAQQNTAIAALSVGYQPPAMAFSWHEFRDRIFHSPGLFEHTSRELAHQFNLATGLSRCHCNELTRVTVSKWRETHLIRCDSCGARKIVESSELVLKAMPDGHHWF